MKELKRRIISLATALLMVMTAGKAVFAGLPAFAADDWDKEDLEGIEHIESFIDSGQTPYTDEEFYGAYDANAGQWVKPGMLNYEGYPNMQPIQDAAKDGDYQAAKSELLNYYRELYKSYAPAYTASTPDARDLYNAYAVKNNFQLNYWMIPAIWGIPKVGNENEIVEIDITDRMPTILGQASPQVTVELFGLKKDGTSLEFESINAGGVNPPVVEVTSKGVIQRIVATDDATISPAENYNKNYGLEATLKAEESVSSIGLDRLTDGNTKRSLIKFDFKSVDASTEPTKAVLKLYGRNASGVGSGELLAAEFNNNSWAEDEVTFYKGKSDVTMEHATFSNYGEDTYKFNGGTSPDLDGGTAVFAYRYPEELLRFTWGTVLGELYAYNRDEEYAITFIDQWVGYLEQRGRDPRYDKTLDGHCRDRDVTQILSIMIDSEYMTPDIWSATMKYYYMEARAQIDGGNDTGNWGVYQIYGTAALATYAPTLDIYDEEIATLRRWSEEKIDDAFYPDGSAHEIEWSYAFTSTFNQLLDANYLMKKGVTGDDIFPDNIQEMGKKIMKYFASVLMPGGGNAQVGDGAGYSSNSYTGKTRNERLAAAFDIPFWTWLGSDGDSGEIPDWTTIRFTGSETEGECVTGVYVSRTDWSDTALYLYTDVDGDMTPGHGHKDDNQIIVKAYGQYLLVDNSFSSYALNRVPLDDTMYHNTVTIDDTAQAMTKTAYQINAGTIQKEKRYETNYLYDNFTLMTPEYADLFGLHTRNTLFLKPGFWIVNDYLEPNDKNVEHKFDQNWHMLPAANPTLDFKGVGTSNFDDTANIKVAQADMQDVTATVKEGYFGGGTGKMYDSHYLNYQKNKKGITTFNTVLYPERPGEDADVSTYEYDLENVTDSGAIAMNINISSNMGEYVDADYYLVNDPEQQRKRTFGSYSTDGRLAYINKDVSGNINEVILQDTTEITNAKTGRVIFKSNNPVAELGWKKEANKITLSTSKNVDLAGLTFYVEKIGDIKRVELNGNSVDFKTNGRYIYFGSSPILTDDDYKPDSGSGGSGGGGSSGGSGGGATGSLSHGNGGSSGAASDKNKPSDKNANTDINPPANNYFNDELSSHWGKEELTKAVAFGIINGIMSDDGAIRLQLDESTTRAQFVAMLIRSLGAEPAEYKGVFKDVSSDSWYAPFVQTAYELGFVQGISEDEFAPERKITREEMAKLLALASEKTNLGGAAENTDKYGDDGKISDWAREYVQSAKNYGVLTGDENNEFRPLAFVTRAEAAVSIVRLKELIEKNKQPQKAEESADEQNDVSEPETAEADTDEL